MNIDLSQWMDASMFWDPLRHDINLKFSGMDLLWRPAFACPCASWNNGQADPACQSCFGLGYGYEASQGPYRAVMGFSYPVEAGMETNLEQGSIATGSPYLVVGGDQDPFYTNLSAYDMVIEENSTTTYNVTLYVGQQETLPFSYGAVVPATSAVRVYDPTAHKALFATYTVSGDTVAVSGYPEGTGYTVKYTANQAYIAFKEGAYPHARPFNASLAMPRRFQLQRLDLWLRKIKAA